MISRLLLSGLLLTALAPGLRAEWAVGRGALQLEASASGVYDSNLRASADAMSDFYLNFHPVVRYRQTDARFHTNAAAGVRIKRYDEHTNSDSEDAEGTFDWSMARDADHTTGADLELRYFENTDAVPDVNEQVRARTFGARARGEVLVARRNLLSATASYHDNQHDVGSDQESYGGLLGYSFTGFTDGTVLNASYAYQHSETADNATGDGRLDQTGRTLSATVSRPLYAEALASLTYGYRWLDRSDQEELASLADSQGDFIAVALEGPFLPHRYFPKTTGTFRLAYEQATTPGLNDPGNERLVGQLNLTWQARERTTVGFILRRAQELTIRDDTVVNTGGSLTVRQAIGNFFNAEAALDYNEADFVGLARTDDRTTARGSLGYQLNRGWSARAEYVYFHSRSTDPIANYDRHLATLTLTYAF